MRKVDKLLKRLRGKDLSRFGIWAKSELEFMKEHGNDRKNLEFIENVVKEHY